MLVTQVVVHTFPVTGVTNRKLIRTHSLIAVWKQAILIRQGYRQVRVELPQLPSYYARAAIWKINSIREPLRIPADSYHIFKKKCWWFIDFPGLAGEHITLPFKVRSDALLNGGKFGDCKLMWRDDRFFLCVPVTRTVELDHDYSAVLGVDLGERFPVTTVLLTETAGTLVPPKFYGQNFRGIRRKYAYMRKQLGKRKLRNQILKISDKEQRTINHELHTISKAIVAEAKANNAVIVLGDLKHIRRRARGKGRRFNRIVSHMPYYRLSQMMTYKANLAGVPVVIADEAYTSKTCHLCHSEGRRVSQGLFKCGACGHQWNADYNGAFNLAARFFGYTLKNGAPRFVPESGTFVPAAASCTI